VADEQSDADFLQQIEEHDERGFMDRAIREAQTELRAHARLQFVAELKQLGDKLASMPADHPFRADAEERIARKKATMAELDRTLFPAGPPALPVEQAMGCEVQTAQSVDLPDSRPRAAIVHDLKLRKGYSNRTRFPEAADITPERLRKWTREGDRRVYKDGSDVDLAVRRAAPRWLRENPPSKQPAPSFSEPAPLKSQPAP
jgi:hypothetical protein